MQVSVTTDETDRCALCGELAINAGVCAFRVGTFNLIIAIPTCADLNCRISAERAITPLHPTGPPDRIIVLPGADR